MVATMFSQVVTSELDRLSWFVLAARAWLPLPATFVPGGRQFVGCLCLDGLKLGALASRQIFLPLTEWHHQEWCLLLNSELVQKWPVLAAWACVP